MWPAFLDPSAADAAFDALLREVPWTQGSVRVFGRVHPEPRLTAWVADPGLTYVYSGQRREPAPWSPVLAALRDAVRDAVGEPYDAVLCNLYRDGRDTMGMHADDEPALGPAPRIASLSLGAVRTFRLRPRDPEGAALDLELPHGSLLVLEPSVQRTHLHGVPRRSRVRSPRVNLTFRAMVGPRP
jgi:alkylated DNA repair dioxygenase AlkB